MTDLLRRLLRRLSTLAPNCLGTPPPSPHLPAPPPPPRRTLHISPVHAPRMHSESPLAGDAVALVRPYVLAAERAAQHLCTCGRP